MSSGANADAEKKRLQKLVEESDIEMTMSLFYGDVLREPETKVVVKPAETRMPSTSFRSENAQSNRFISSPEGGILNENWCKKTFVKPIKNVSTTLKTERKLARLLLAKEKFGESEERCDPYELEYGHLEDT